MTERPAYHFTPPVGWMNDPNGLVQHQGRWHLFYQHHPHSLVWGPMHWGHASSANLLTWQHHPVALAPDELGAIFSGSVVPAGPGRLAALFTHHHMGTGLEAQGLATSGDAGLRWAKHPGNPVLANPGLKDFRDPKLLWWEAESCWLMALAAGDHVRFYRSADLLAWAELGRFGPGHGTGGGVWECPDLFTLPAPGGGQRWVLLLSLTSGAPNGGSGTRYFIGHFDGQQFTPEHQDVRWLDHGPDNYAGVTWAGTGARRTWVGWMNNWHYAREVPASTWRGAMALPRELALVAQGGALHLASPPAPECGATGWQPAPAHDLGALVAASGFRLGLTVPATQGFTLTLANPAGDRLVLGLDTQENSYYIDRRGAGQVAFAPGFALRARAPRVATTAWAEVELWCDHGSVELFGDGGLANLTALVFPHQPWRLAELSTPATSAHRWVGE